MRRATFVAVTLLVVAFGLVRGSAPASADWIWCWDDPTLSINGKTVHINIGVPSDQAALITGATLTVTVPANVNANLSGVNAAQGTGSLHTTSTLVTSGTYSGTGPIPVSVSVTVSGPSGTPVQLSAWQSSVGDLGQNADTTGAVIPLSFSVQ